MAYDIMEVELIFDELNEKTTKSVGQLTYELTNLRAGRANVHILDGITVDYYGAETPLNQVANLSVPEARLLVVTVWDTSLMKKVEKAIVDANIGIMPTNDGKVIRLAFPEPTEERRRGIVKDIRNYAEKSKVATRNIRRDAMSDLKALEKSKIISEDQLKTYEVDIDKIVTAKIVEIDKLAVEKEAEILKV